MIVLQLFFSLIEFVPVASTKNNRIEQKKSPSTGLSLPIAKFAIYSIIVNNALDNMPTSSQPGPGGRALSTMLQLTLPNTTRNVSQCSYYLFDAWSLDPVCIGHLTHSRRSSNRSSKLMNGEELRSGMRDGELWGCLMNEC